MIRDLLNLVLPKLCPLCRSALPARVSVPFCPKCSQGIVTINDPRCLTCGRPLSPLTVAGNPDHFKCGACRARPLHLDSARSLASFEGPVKEGIHLMKYSGHWKLGARLIRYLASGIENIPFQADALVPVPLHPLRLRYRGFNQSVVLAREISKILKIPVALDLLTRNRKAQPQVGLKGNERLQNVRGCFQIGNKAKTGKGRIILVDDVITTGATANECALILKQAGTETVHLLALAGAYGSFDSG